MTENPHLPDQILDWLYLGGRQVRENKEILEELKIRHVLDFSKIPGLDVFDFIHYKIFDVEDTENSDITCLFETCLSLMQNARENNENVLLHCNQGRSRSATIVLAYLIKYENMSLKSAFFYLKERRRVIMPNLGFFQQLIQLELNVHGTTTLVLGKYGQIQWIS